MLLRPPYDVRASGGRRTGVALSCSMGGDCCPRRLLPSFGDFGVAPVVENIPVSR